ncbi:MAG: phage tail sheath family protein [Vicinamibacterales bacterium]
MATYRTPGVYVEEVATLPPSVAEVATAVPAFIGHTQRVPAGAGDPAVLRVATMLEFEGAFGGALPVGFKVTEPDDPAAAPAIDLVPPTSPFSLHDAVSLYFRNGGGPCYIVSVGDYEASPSLARFSAGLAALEREDEPTLLVLTDAACVLTAGDYYVLCAEALQQCRTLGDRFTIIDVVNGDWKAFRNDASLSVNLAYGAAYHPYLQTVIGREYVESAVRVIRRGAAQSTDSGALTLGGDNGLRVGYSGPSGGQVHVAVDAGTKSGQIGFSIQDGTLTIANANAKAATDLVAAWTTWASANGAGGFDLQPAGDGSAVVTNTKDIAATPIPLTSTAGSASLADLKTTQTALYNRAKTALAGQRVTLPPSAAVAGIYARVDREQGVWKAPANVGVLAVIGPTTKVTNDDQDQLNVDPTGGKSINAIREFTGRGTLVWGGRTLAGNDNEWRYVSVRRLFLVIEESTRKATAFAVFEANDQSTWLKVKAMIESYLYGLWQQGALAGSKPDEAYFVRVGLRTTMTEDDVLAGRMIVEIGVAAVRPAEFIVLRFSHKMQTA